MSRTGDRRPTRQELSREFGDVLHDLPLFMTTPLYRHWHLHWGATSSEVGAVLPGDELVSHPQFRATRAITIHAPPDLIWPWLVQIGSRRAGWYSNDLLDNAGRPSATEIMPHLQQVALGQWVPMSPSGPPTEANAFKVHSFVANQWLLWTKPDSTWSWRLSPLDDRDATRLVTRIGASYDWSKPAKAGIALVLMEFGDFAMCRRMLRGIKFRAEKLALEYPTQSRTRTASEDGVAQ